MSSKLFGLSALLEEEPKKEVAFPETEVSKFLDSIGFQMSGKIPVLESRAESWKKEWAKDLAHTGGDYFHYGQRYDYTRLKIALYYSLQDVKTSFVKVGRILRMMRDTPSPFCSTYEEEALTFGLSKSSVYALVGVYERFGTEDGELKPDYRNLSYSALVEWLPCSDEEVHQYHDVYRTVADIRQYKKNKQFQTSGKTEEKQKPVDVLENQISFVDDQLKSGSLQVVEETSSESEFVIKNWERIDIEEVCADLGERYHVSEQTALEWLCTALQSNVIMEELVKQIDYLLEQGQLWR